MSTALAAADALRRYKRLYEEWAATVEPEVGKHSVDLSDSDDNEEERPLEVANSMGSQSRGVYGNCSPGAEVETKAEGKEGSAESQGPFASAEEEATANTSTDAWAFSSHSS